MPTIAHWLWGLWAGGIVALAVWFDIMEGIAMANGGSRDTLSEAIWDHTHLPAAVVFVGAGIVVFGAIWFCIHIVSKGKWGI
ncbi:MAG: hypothetical protein MUO35_03815 [Anaerolineales bacterium]|nr:hypothetical protein [Anaerolineales bacterium]